MKTESLIEHIESYLGKTDLGWVLRQPSTNIQVARFREQPVIKASTYVTIGLSHHVLQMPRNREVRQELVFSAYDHFNSEEIASFLLTFSSHVITKHEALLRGQVVGPSDTITPSTPLNAVYIAIPILFDDLFATFNGTSPPTVFVWTLPLHASEATYVRQNGWGAFEDRLEEIDPDLLDLTRQPVV